MGTAAGLTLATMSLVAPQAASAATARNGVCEAGEFCYYYNSNETGSISDFSASLGSYGDTQPDCYDFKTAGQAGFGVCVKNNAASVVNNTSVPVTVYYNSNYGGASQTFAPGARANLNATLKNNEASHLFGSPSTPPPPPSTGGSAVNGPISRSEVLARAQNWVDRGIWYSQSAYTTDVTGTMKYRQDCSGFVSMAWHLNNSYVTSTLPGVSTQLGSLDELQPGDMIDNVSTHVVLFVGWTDSTHQTAKIVEEQKTGTQAHYTTYSRSYINSNGYHGYRYNRITG